MPDALQAERLNRTKPRLYVLLGSDTFIGLDAGACLKLLLNDIQF